MVSQRRQMRGSHAARAATKQRPRGKFRTIAHRFVVVRLVEHAAQIGLLLQRERALHQVTAIEQIGLAAVIGRLLAQKQQVLWRARAPRGILVRPVGDEPDIAGPWLSVGGI